MLVLCSHVPYFFILMPVQVSNTFYFTFTVRPEAKVTQNGFRFRNVVPATEEEATRILERMDAESLLPDKIETGK